MRAHTWVQDTAVQLARCSLGQTETRDLRRGVAAPPTTAHILQLRSRHTHTTDDETPHENRPLTDRGPPDPWTMDTWLMGDSEDLPSATGTAECAHAMRTHNAVTHRHRRPPATSDLAACGASTTSQSTPPCTGDLILASGLYSTPQASAHDRGGARQWRANTCVSPTARGGAASSRGVCVCSREELLLLRQQDNGRVQDHMRRMEMLLGHGGHDRQPCCSSVRRTTSCSQPQCADCGAVMACAAIRESTSRWHPAPPG